MKIHPILSTVYLKVMFSNQNELLRYLLEPSTRDSGSHREPYSYIHFFPQNSFRNIFWIQIGQTFSQA